MNRAKLLQLILLTFTIVTLSFGLSKPEAKSNCRVLKDCKLKYYELPNADTSAYIIIKDNKHIEIFNNGEAYIKSDLTWLSDCEFNVKITDFKVKDFPFGIGTVMNVKIDGIKNRIVSYTSNAKGIIIKGKFIII